MFVSDTCLYLYNVCIDKVSFCTQAGERCEEIIQLLTKNDIGVEHNSTVRYILRVRYSYIMSLFRGLTRFIAPWSNISYLSMHPFQGNVIGALGDVPLMRGLTRVMEYLLGKQGKV